jgi:hypothetical protein
VRRRVELPAVAVLLARLLEDSTAPVVTGGEEDHPRATAAAAVIARCPEDHSELTGAASGQRTGARAVRFEVMKLKVGVKVRAVRRFIVRIVLIFFYFRTPLVVAFGVGVGVILRFFFPFETTTTKFCGRRDIRKG